jgi:hypothetical protein
MFGLPQGEAAFTGGDDGLDVHGADYRHRFGAGPALARRLRVDRESPTASLAALLTPPWHSRKQNIVLLR